MNFIYFLSGRADEWRGSAEVEQQKYAKRKSVKIRCWLALWTTNYSHYAFKMSFASHQFIIKGDEKLLKLYTNIIMNAV